jgi:hypothetical protein
MVWCSLQDAAQVKEAAAVEPLREASALAGALFEWRTLPTTRRDKCPYPPARRDHCAANFRASTASASRSAVSGGARFQAQLCTDPSCVPAKTLIDANPASKAACRIFAYLAQPPEQTILKQSPPSSIARMAPGLWTLHATVCNWDQLPMPAHRHGERANIGGSKYGS